MLGTHGGVGGYMEGDAGLFLLVVHGAYGGMEGAGHPGGCPQKRGQ